MSNAKEKKREGKKEKGKEKKKEEGNMEHEKERGKRVRKEEKEEDEEEEYQSFFIFTMGIKGRGTVFNLKVLHSNLMIHFTSADYPCRASCHPLKGGSLVVPQECPAHCLLHDDGCLVSFC